MPRLPVAVAAASDPGRVRDNNEDSFAFEPADSPRAAERGVLCVVADGVGGQAAGEVASSTAVRVVMEHYYGSQSTDLPAALRTAVEDANDEVWRQAGGNLERVGMASTCTAAVVHQDRVILAHVGDSRAYLVRSGAIRQLSTDHSQVAELVAAGVLTPEEARHHPNRNIILRALGREASVNVDVLVQPVQDGDTIVLCSDGLSSMVTDVDIADLASRGTLNEAAARLIARANEGGAPDNVTVGLLQVGERPATVLGRSPTIIVGDASATAVGPAIPAAPEPRGGGLPLLPIGLGLLALVLVLGLGSLFFLRASEPAPPVASQAPPVAATVPPAAPTQAQLTTPPTAAPTSPPATQPPAPTAPPPTAAPAATSPPPASAPAATGSAPAPPAPVEAPSRPVIVSPSTGEAAPPLDPELARALEEGSVSEDTREICRQARPDRPVEARVRDPETVRGEPDPAAPSTGIAAKDAVVSVAECVLGAPVEDSRVWLRLGEGPPGGAGPGFILASRVVRSEPRDLPSGGGSGRSLGAEPTQPAPASSPPPLQEQPFESKPSTGQFAPEPGSLNRR